MSTAELAERPDSLTSDIRPPAFALVQALSQTLPQPETPQLPDPFETLSDGQPSDHGYDDYWLDPLEP